MCTNAVNNVQPIKNSSHMAKILSVYNRLQAGDYENGSGGKRRVSRLTQFMHATLLMILQRCATIGGKYSCALKHAPPLHGKSYPVKFAYAETFHQSSVNFLVSVQLQTIG